MVWFRAFCGATCRVAKTGDWMGRKCFGISVAWDVVPVGGGMGPNGSDVDLIRGSRV